jgi:L-asparaginase II
MDTANPVLVELTRGQLIESSHRGAIAIADASGRIVLALGDVGHTVYPRSSLKPLQALPLLESGAAAAFGLSDEEVALACASHSGEPMHTERVRAWLSRLGLSVADLACGPHPIRDEPTRTAMLCAHQDPTAIHNNCSGKHTGFLTLAKHLGAPTAGYVQVDHAVQRRVQAVIAELGALEGTLPWGVDGCAAPNFALPLAAFARALASFTTPDRHSPARAAAMRRIVKAMTTYPELVSGTGRACAILMRAAQGRVAVKTGAEGVFAAIVPHRQLAIALKIDDGATRASETAMAFLLERLGLLAPDAAAQRLVCTPILNTKDTVVGECRAAPALAGLDLTGL